MDMPKRKQLRLKYYDYSQNGMYFVTICTNNRECLFNNIVGEDLCVLPNNPDKIASEWLKEVENKFQNVLIDKYVIMPNHIHFILAIEGAGAHAGVPLQEMVQWYKTQTTNAYIKGVKSGLFPKFNNKIWQRSYYEHIIRNEKNYQEIWQYIDSNILLWNKDEFFVG